MPGRKLTLPVAECLLSLALPFLASAAPMALALNGKATVEDGRARYVRTAPGKGDSGFSLTWRFPEWTDDTYVFLPACAYNGNRDFSHFLKEYPSEIYYPPKFDASLVGKENARVVTNIPKLNEDGSGRIEVTSGDTATPCVGLFFPAARKGVLIFTSQQVGGMNVGYMVEKGCVIVSCPADRSDQYLFCRAHVSPHPDRPLTMAQGEEAEIRFLYLEFEAADIPSFYETFFRNRQRLLPGRRIPAPYTREVCAAVENGINRDSWMKEGFWAEGTTGRWTVGWVAGMPVAWGMLNAGSNLSRARARMVPDFLVAHQSETGAYREWWPNDRNRMGDDRISQDIGRDYWLVRRSATGLFYLLRFADVMELKPAWKASARRAADAFVRTWREYKDWGMFADLGNGAPVIRGSANAAHAPAALVRAARIFGDSTYLDVALESGRAYYERFIAKGLTYGGPNEALMAPDSESAAMLLESLVTLAEETKSADWIRRARDAAHYLSSWVVSYPYAFPRDSEFGRLGINTTGAVFANCQNKHAAPGICTGSGDALYRLYRMTGDRAYFDLCREIAAFIPQTVSTDVRPIRARDGEGLMPSGWINERVNMSDWEGTDAVGTVFYGTCWCTAAFMCTCADLVGIEELDLKPKETQRQDSQIGKPKCHQNQTGKDTDK